MATPTPRAPRADAHQDGRGAGWWALRQLYGGLVLMVLLLPANSFAYFVSLATNGGSALQGIGYTFGHHVSGWYVTALGHRTAVWAVAWWAEALWEGLFWVGCASAVLLFALWVGRALWLRRATEPARRLPMGA